MWDASCAGCGLRSFGGGRFVHVDRRRRRDCDGFIVLCRPCRDRDMPHFIEVRSPESAGHSPAPAVELAPVMSVVLEPYVVGKASLSGQADLQHSVMLDQQPVLFVIKDLYDIKVEYDAVGSATGAQVDVGSTCHIASTPLAIVVVSEGLQGDCTEDFKGNGDDLAAGVSDEEVSAVGIGTVASDGAFADTFAEAGEMVLVEFVAVESLVAVAGLAVSKLEPPGVTKMVEYTEYTSVSELAEYAGFVAEPVVVPAEVLVNAAPAEVARGQQRP